MVRNVAGADGGAAGVDKKSAAGDKVARVYKEAAAV